jgi:hypothetical protein
VWIHPFVDGNGRDVVGDTRYRSRLVGSTRPGTQC